MDLTIDVITKTEQRRDCTSIISQIIVGTPGTIMSLIKNKVLGLGHVKVFVIDEADNMLDLQGLGDQSARIKVMIDKSTTKVQTLLFSATFEENVLQFATRVAPNANMITLKREELSIMGIKQLYMDCKTEEQKFETLILLYSLMTIGQSIIFVAVYALNLNCLLFGWTSRGSIRQIGSHIA